MYYRPIRLTERQLLAHVHRKVSAPDGRSVPGRRKVLLIDRRLVVIEYTQRLLLVDVRGANAARDQLQIHST